jgi:hypothetical protein
MLLQKRIFISAVNHQLSMPVYSLLPATVRRYSNRLQILESFRSIETEIPAVPQANSCWNHEGYRRLFFNSMVGVTGLEPAAPPSRTYDARANLRLTITLYYDKPGKIRPKFIEGCHWPKGWQICPGPS